MQKVRSTSTVYTRSAETAYIRTYHAEGCSLLYRVVLDDSTLQVMVESVRVLNDKLLVLDNSL